MTPQEHILKLKDGESWTWPESDYGKAEIWRINNIYILFEIKMLGEPMYAGKFNVYEIDELIKEVESWT